MNLYRQQSNSSIQINSVGFAYVRGYLVFSVVLVVSSILFVRALLSRLV